MRVFVVIAREVLRVAPIALFTTLVVTAPAAGQQDPQPPPQAEVQPPAPETPRAQGFDGESLATLKALHESITARKQSLVEEEAKLRGEQDADLRKELAENVRVQQTEIRKLERNLESIATGVDLDQFEAPARGTFRLADEVQELLRPLVEELKDATEDPRQLEQLRSDLAHHTDRQQMAQRALENLRRLINMAEDESAKSKLDELYLEWERRRAEAVRQATVTKHQLESRLRDRKSILDSTRGVLSSFFRNRGLNLLLALLAFCSMFFGLRFVAGRLLRLAGPKRIRRGRPFYLRLLQVLMQGAILLLALVAALMVLYAAGDWLLLGLALLFMLGLGWASKATLPRVFEQVRLLLNLGAVRERERVVFEGIPWRIDSINVYSYLTNPALSGGRIRLSLREMIGLHSRPCMEKEIWFPCHEGDWVRLSDETFGKVLSQTPEMVQLVQLGGNLLTYQTASFLELSPANLSTNYRLRVTFGVDYRHQAIATSEIPAIMQAAVRDALVEAVGESNLIHLAAEFKEAGSSSLDYAILADLSGDVADRSDKLKRLIPRVLVDVCNAHGWTIPFTQITLHQA